MNEPISIFFDRQLKLQAHLNNQPVEDKRYDLLYCWVDDHWYDLLSLLGERYVLFGWYDDFSYIFVTVRIFDQVNNKYLLENEKIELLKNHRYVGKINRE